MSRNLKFHSFQEPQNNTVRDQHSVLRVLLIEDDLELSRAIALALSEGDFVVDSAFDGNDGLSMALALDYDLIVLDLMLPGISGEQVLAILRQVNKTPVLVLTARDSHFDKIGCLNLGADDYVTKPFDLDEFLARIRAVLRRSLNHTEPVIEIGEISVNTASRCVFRSGQKVVLTAKEYAVLYFLLTHRGKSLSRDKIYEQVYGEQVLSESNLIDVYVAKLRKKLGSGLIATQRGVGYTIHA